MRIRSIVILVVVVLAIATLAAIAGANEPTTSTASPTATPVATSTATPVQAATIRVYTPTLTTKLTATPTILQRLIKALGPDADTATYNPVTHVVVIHVTRILPPDPPTHMTYAQIVEASKFSIYSAFGDVYTSGISGISSVEVHQLWAKCGFTPDIKNNTGQCSGTQLQYPGDFARATCTSTTAKLIDWNNGDDDTAWTVYDSTYLLPGN